jgi:glycosyltransferase involved in cell wall biosynthesis
VTVEVQSDTLPLVTVGIATYNRAVLLRQSLQSVLDQDYANLEIIISDNASGDDTWTICGEASARDRRVRVYRQAENTGPTANLEFVRSQAAGKYFMWLADDDFVSRAYVRSCVQKLESDPDLALVYGTARNIHSDGLESVSPSFVLSQRHAFARVLEYFRRVGDNAMFYGVYRRQVLVGCRLPNILGGDWAWIGEVVLHGRAIAEPKATIYRRMSGTSISYERILQVINAPAWMRRFPFLALVLGISCYIALRSEAYKTAYPIGRFLVAPLIAAILTIRLKVKPFLGRFISAIKRISLGESG